MSIKDSYNKKVTFDTWDRLENKMDKFTEMMGKLALRDNWTNRQFKPQIHQCRRRGQSKNTYNSHNYARGNYKIVIDQIVEIEEYNLVDKVEVDWGINKLIGKEILGAKQDHIKIYEDIIVEKVMIILWKNYPTTKEEREIVQIQQMFNLYEEQTYLKLLVTELMIALTKKFFRKYVISRGTFKLMKGKNDPTRFLPLNANISREIRPDKYESKENKYLMENQARHVYKKVESGNIITLIHKNKR